jgi:antitoxin component YwqK of YwqJK toxin-antitoxin module
MTRDQHLEFCKRCKNREFDTQQGIICSLTKRIAAFEGTCENFNLDESVKIEAPPAEAIPAYQVVNDLSGEVKVKLRTQQDLVYAIVGGLSAAIVGAILWALITVATKYQIGYMAIGVGLLVGFAVRYFGAGVDYVFGIVGAFFALLGCALGNLLSQVGFIADAQSIGYFDVLTLLNFTTLGTIAKESFAPMDIVFYGIAAYEGYKFAFRALPDELIKATAAGRLVTPQYANLRLPIVIVLFVGLSTTFFLIHKKAVGTKTYYYDSGAKLSEGTMNYGIEEGEWNFYWENGKRKHNGFFKEGQQDGLWKFYDEGEILYRKGTFKQDLQDGIWEDFYPNGKPSSSGSFIKGRQHGSWTYYYEDGTISQKGQYYYDVPDGNWETFYQNGKPGSKGSYHKNELTGIWTYWYENGERSQELEYTSNSYSKILNSWDEKGKQQVANGNGVFFGYYTTGELGETGKVTNFERTGIWKKLSVKGNLQEEGEYKKGIYYLINSYSFDGKPRVVNGEGTFESYYDEVGTIQETGIISKGLKTGEWKILSAEKGNTLQKMSYVSGQIVGEQVSYFEDGIINVEGRFANNLREGEWKWYHQNGNVETTVNFVKGEKQGEQPFFDMEGNLNRTEVYSNGAMVEVRMPSK